MYAQNVRTFRNPVVMRATTTTTTTTCIDNTYAIQCQCKSERELEGAYAPARASKLKEGDR